MIIHTNSDNAKPIEQRVRDLMLNKIHFKVDDDQIFIDKEVFISLILMDIVAVARGQYDIDKALGIALKEQSHYKDAPESKRNGLIEVADQFAIEVDAYFHYLDSLKINTEHDKIYDEVSFMLNNDQEVFQIRMHELMMKAVGSKVPEMDDSTFDRYSLIDSFANQIRFIASNESIDDAVEEAYYEYNSIKEGLFTKPYLKREFERFAPLAKDEIKAYKLALSLLNQNAEIGMILATVKQLFSF